MAGGDGSTLRSSAVAGVSAPSNVAASKRHASKGHCVILAISALSELRSTRAHGYQSRSDAAEALRGASCMLTRPSSFASETCLAAGLKDFVLARTRATSASQAASGETVDLGRNA